MAFWKIAEPLLVALLAVILITQVVVAPLIGKPFFWVFRKPERKLRQKGVELDDARTLKNVHRLDKKIEKEKAETE